MKIHLVTFLLVIFLSVSAYARQTSLFLGLTPGYLHYNEKEYNTTVDRDYGFLPGLNAEILSTNKSWWIRGNFSFAMTRNATYKGQTQSGLPLKFKDEHETIWMGEADLGYSFGIEVPWGAIDVTPYTGIGYRHWKRGQVDKDTGNYKEVYTWGFVPVGVNVMPRSRPRSYAVGFDLAILLPLSPRLDARLHGLDPTLRNTKLDLPWRPGFRVQIPMSYKFSHRWSVCLKPEYNYWAFGDSGQKAAAAGLLISEPAGTTHCLRVMLGVSYTW